MAGPIHSAGPYVEALPAALMHDAPVLLSTRSLSRAGSRSGPTGSGAATRSRLSDPRPVMPGGIAPTVGRPVAMAKTRATERPTVHHPHQQDAENHGADNGDSRPHGDHPLSLAHATPKASERGSGLRHGGRGVRATTVSVPRRTSSKAPKPGSTDLRLLRATIRARWLRRRPSKDVQAAFAPDALPSHPSGDARDGGHRWIQAKCLPRPPRHAGQRPVSRDGCRDAGRPLPPDQPPGA